MDIRYCSSTPLLIFLPPFRSHRRNEEALGDVGLFDQLDPKPKLKPEPKLYTVVLQLVWVLLISATE